MSKKALLISIVLLPALLLGQPKSALEFYDSTGTAATARFGWHEESGGGKFYIQTPVGSEALNVKQGKLTVNGDVEATRFVGDGSRLTNIAQPAGLQAELDSKADTNHQHSTADVTGLQTALGAKAEVDHTHPQADVNGLQASLASKADTNHSHLLSEVAPLGIDSTNIRNGRVGREDLAQSSVDGSKISDGSITDADISANARIAGTKIRPRFGNSQIYCSNGIYMHWSGDETTGFGAGAFPSTDKGYFSLFEYQSHAHKRTLLRCDFDSDTFNLYMNLKVHGAVTANSCCQTSDRRFKRHITEVEAPLDKVRALRGVEFDWATAEYPDRQFSDRRQLGFIAQEVEQVAPEAVSTDGEGYKYVDYGKLVPLLTEALKEQQHMIEQQKAELKSQRAELELLKAHINKL